MLIHYDDMERSGTPGGCTVFPISYHLLAIS